MERESLSVGEKERENGCFRFLSSSPASIRFPPVYVSRAERARHGGYRGRGLPTSSALAIHQTRSGETLTRITGAVAQASPARGQAEPVPKPIGRTDRHAAAPSATAHRGRGQNAFSSQITRTACSSLRAPFFSSRFSSLPYLHPRQPTHCPPSGVFSFNLRLYPSAPCHSRYIII